MDKIQEQAHIWAAYVKGAIKEDNHFPAYDWGDPLSEEAVSVRGDMLGNYLKITEQYLSLDTIYKKTAIDLGSLTGKWTDFIYRKCPNKIICVDIIPDGFNFMKNSWHPIAFDKVEFYLTEGNELRGIENESVDFIFSMDSLVRSSKDIIEAYIAEIKRVLKPGGKTCIHLPCEEQHLSWELGFTQFNKQQLRDMLDKHGIDKYSIDDKTINHGVLLLINN